MSEAEVTTTQQIAEKIGGWTLIIFGLRTAALIAGVFIARYGLLLLWELRPIRRKKYGTVVDARVTELNEEKRSASMNVYFMPRFEYEQDGVIKAFSPKKAYRPCRLKLNGAVKLCLGENGKFRAVRKDISFKKAAAFTLIGLALVLSQLLF
jgi:hypothetical protein